MNIFVEGKPFQVDVPPDATYGAIIKTVEELMTQKNRIVSSVSIDSKKLTSDEEETLTGQVIAADSRIDVEVIEARALLVKALEEAEQDLSGLSESMRQVAFSLQTGLKQEAFTIFQGCLEIWRQVINLLQLSQEILQCDIENIDIDGKTIREINENLVQVLMETKDAMEADDLVRISDMLEYELCAKAEEEQKVVQRLIELAGSNSVVE